MTIREVINKIYEYHPKAAEGKKDPDVFFGGDPDVTCTGILVSIAPTVEIIRKAIDIGANFIYVHEPAFYSAYDADTDWLKGNEVFEEKMALLKDNGIVVLRDHDRTHVHNPDDILYWMVKELGWLEYATYPGSVPGLGSFPDIKLPETTLGEVVKHVKEAFHVPVLRYIGDLNAKVSTVGFCWHLLPHEGSNWSNNDLVAASWKYDVIIPAELVEWTVPAYVRDAVQLGKAKGLIAPGHYFMEEAGIKWSEGWLRPLVGEELPITFISAGDTFSYL